ncbi:MAG: alpha/beta fold hydrolase [Verrucomicrobiota bacterium]
MEIRFEESSVIQDGRLRRRYLWYPDRKPRGGVILLHGLGDHLTRYQEVAHMFTLRGFVCEGVDLPGHGKSEGQRGHLGSWESLWGVFDDCRTRLAELSLNETPLMGLFAHSMGGFLSAEYVADRSGAFDFAWLSSPLLRPTARHSATSKWLGKVLGASAPRIPWDTGVRAKHCVIPEENGSRPSGKSKDPLMHHWTTLGSGRELITRESTVFQSAERWTEDMSLLLTQGEKDPVCPPQYSRDWFDRLPLGEKSYEILEGELHEPLHSRSGAEVLRIAGAWMDGYLAGRDGLR